MLACRLISSRLIRLLGVVSLTMTLGGCSSLGLSCFPTGHFLTDQAEAILERAPRQVELPRELSLSPMPAHYLQPGDQLLVEPVDPESEIRIPADQRVMLDGTLDLGGIGRVQVTGLTLEAAEDLIEKTIFDSGEEETSVNVRLLEPVHRYYVLGEVNSPGSYPLVGHETVLDGIVLAGGLTSEAASCKILLARPTPPASCRVTLPICYREIAQLGDTTTNYQLQPGDRIYVSSRTWCEELLFWRATDTCPRCTACQYGCVDPTLASPPASVVSEPIEAESPSSPYDRGDAKRRREASFSETLGRVGPVRIQPVVDESESPESPLMDGQLDFDAPTSRERFEPLWIKPAEEAESSSP